MIAHKNEGIFRSINPIKYIQDFYAKIYKILIKEIKEVLNKGETHCVHGLEDVTY